MADPKKSPEIVTEEELKPVLENKAFDSTTFLRLYSEWKTTKDQTTFASLRKMHEDAGYNNKNVIFGAEQEMHEIAAIVQRYQDGKIQITRNTANATANTIDSVKSDMERELSAITDADLEKMKWALGKTEAILTAFESINPTQKETARGFLGLALITRLNQAWYQVTLQWSKIDVKALQNTKATQSQAVQLKAFLDTNPKMQENIAYGLIYGSSEFKGYSDVYTKIDGDKKTVITPKQNYLDYFSEATKWKASNQLSLADQSLIASRSSIEWILKDPKTVTGLILGAPQIQVAMQTLANNPAQVQQAAQAIAQAATSAPANSGNRVSPAPSTNTPVNSNNMVSKILGKAGIAVEGGFSDIMNTPGAPLAVLIAFIATWVFGDFKKALAVGLGAFGISSVANAYEANKNEKNTGWNSTTWGTKKAPQAAPKTTPKMDHTIDTSKRTAEEQKMWNHVKSTPQLLKDLDTRWEKLSIYMDFIYTNKLLDKPVSDLVLSTQPKNSIFTDSAVLPDNFPAIGTLSMIQIKRILRLLLWQNYKYPANDPDGNNAKTNFVPSKLLKDTNDQKISESDWKNKKLSDAINLISKQF